MLQGKTVDECDSKVLHLIQLGVVPYLARFLLGLNSGDPGPVRLFFTGEIGFDNFSISNQNATAGFTNTVGPTSGSTFFVVYPGGGIEAFAGPIGLRAEIGDDIYSTMSLTII
jgi:hypothetical protein